MYLLVKFRTRLFKCLSGWQCSCQILGQFESNAVLIGKFIVLFQNSHHLNFPNIGDHPIYDRAISKAIMLHHSMARAKLNKVENS